MIDDRFAKPWPHRCDPYGNGNARKDGLLNGTRWICDCGTGWVLTLPSPISLAHWDAETRQQRRQRLKADRKARR